MAKRKQKLVVKAPESGHFYATSLAEWKVDNDVEKLAGHMRAGGFPFTLTWVPLPIDADYEIENWVPVVEGCIKLAEYKIPS